jgi:DNA primase
MITPRRIVFETDNETRYRILCGTVDMYSLLQELNLENIEDRGNEIYADCPFHEDRKQHWSINVNQTGDRWGVHSCFVCVQTGSGAGNVVTLVRDLLGLETYGNALSWIESFFGIEKTENCLLHTSLSKRKDRLQVKPNRKGEEDPDQLYRWMAPVQPNTPHWRYLINRGITPEQIRSRGIKKGEHRYKGRVVFPIIHKGVVVNFYARAIGNLKPKGLYAKVKGTIASSLFGYDKANLLSEYCYVSEGCFDVLAIERAIGFPKSQNIFATNGPIIHQEQAKLLKIFPIIILVPDMKGKAKSIIPTAIRYLGRNNLGVVEPPRGCDIDDWISKDLPAATEALLNPVPLRRSRVITKVNYSVR